jgi:hypothetical protein
MGSVDGRSTAGAARCLDKVPARTVSYRQTRRVAIHRSALTLFILLIIPLAWAACVPLTAALRVDSAGMSVPKLPVGALGPMGPIARVQEPPKIEHKPKPAKSADGPKQGKANKLPKITICHHPKEAGDQPVTINVNEHAWRAHEKHGDTRAACGS